MAVLVWSIVLAVVVPIICLASCVYFIVYFQDPHDRSVAYLPKIIVIFGLMLCLVTVLTIPFDESNHGTVFDCSVFDNLPQYCGDLKFISWIWLIEITLIVVFLLVVFPVTEVFVRRSSSRSWTWKSFLKAAFVPMTISLISFVGFIIAYFSLSATQPPILEYVVNEITSCGSKNCFETSVSVGVPNSTADVKPNNFGDVREKTLAIDTIFLVYLLAFFAFFGWFFFAVYTGIGFVALPLHFIKAFTNRPKYIPRDSYALLKRELQREANDLLKVGEELRSKETSAASGSRFNIRHVYKDMKLGQQRDLLLRDFKASVIKVEEEVELLKLSHEKWMSYNPLIPWLKLVCGIFSVILSLIWMLQLLIFSIARSPFGARGKPASPLFNSVLSAASNANFAFFGTLLICIFTFYLFVALLRGKYSFGFRFFIVEIYPLKVGETSTSSFLANVSILLLCTPALIAFTANLFSDYVASTDLNFLFNQQIFFLPLFSFFVEYRIFDFILLFSSIAWGIYELATYKNKKRTSTTTLLKRAEELKNN